MILLLRLLLRRSIMLYRRLVDLRLRLGIVTLSNWLLLGIHLRIRAWILIILGVNVALQTRLGWSLIILILARVLRLAYWLIILHIFIRINILNRQKGLVDWVEKKWGQHRSRHLKRFSLEGS